ncbi:hypothetical protein Skr01_51900 [Sphaerisporangium krabiense]|uniref:Uncharacterized protein n=1 Tax=Sphaerisporangium krabiense TaxID=763782 RepID=A0A7W8Z9Z8_9ACTN|nr:hypothetical protein [Sphaerisporangium krabiense]MBB5630154.1 hypothetical protein [Sphaerisporangium krabiense]GII65105.1 hypothetical protein Skr01_51900 [Sphaerisporangium krabiense]
MTRDSRDAGPDVVVIVPPLGDVTLSAEWTAGPHRLLDPGRRFIARVLATAPALAASEGAHDGSGRSAPGAQHDADAGGASGADGDGERVVRLRAGVAVLADPAGPMARLRAAGLLVPAVTETHPGSAVDLVLDDLELRDGTTEDSAAASRASAGPAPYDPELEEALAAVSPGDEVWLVLERDQQLPAALALAARLPGPVRVTGRYAHRHWPVLARLSPLHAASLATPPSPLRWRVTGLPGAAPRGETDAAPQGETEVYWRERAADPVPPGPWAGRVSLRQAVEAPGELVAAGCVTAVLGLCAADHEFAGRGGSAWPAEKARAAFDVLRASGVTVLAELWLGAPGVPAARTRAAVETLTAPGGPVDRLVGLRPFDWPTHWDDPRWGETHVRWGRTGAERDLARHREFLAEGTLSRAEVQELVSEIGPGLARAGTLIPARVAAAYLAPGSLNDGTDGTDGTDGENGVALAADTVVVAGPAASGQWYAVDLRAGRIVRLDPRVASRLRVGRRVVPEAEALPGVAPAVRARVLDALVGGGLLIRR